MVFNLPIYTMFLIPSVQKYDVLWIDGHIVMTHRSWRSTPGQLLKKLAQATPKGLLHLFVPIPANFPTYFFFYAQNRSVASAFRFAGPHRRGVGDVQRREATAQIPAKGIVHWH